jgi:hypothetical protein
MKPIPTARLLLLISVMRCVGLTLIYLPLPVPKTGGLRAFFMIIFFVLSNPVLYFAVYSAKKSTYAKLSALN